MLPFHFAPPRVPSDGRRHEAPPRHDGACAGLVLQSHQQSRRHVAVGDLQFLHDVVADFLVPSPRDGFRIPFLQRAAHYLESGLPQCEIDQIAKHLHAGGNAGHAFFVFRLDRLFASG